MKTRNLLMMGMVAVAMMLGGCAETDNDVMETTPTVKDGQTVKIKVVDNGYGDVTRAAESNEEEAQGENTIMQTNFIAGDKIGVFSISAGGAVHYNNLQLHYDGTEWEALNGETFYYFSGMRYFAYYPYNPDFDVSKVDWTKTAVDEFFAPYVADWQPQADQSTTSKYMASDLMIGGGALSGETFTFSMGHTMGLIFVSVAEVLKGTAYLFPKLTESEAMTDFDADANSKIFSFEQKVYKPSQKQGYYRYIVKPGNAQFISGMNPDGRTFSFTCDNVSAGHYKKFVVDGGFDSSLSDITDFTVELGDIIGYKYYGGKNRVFFAKRPETGKFTSNSTNGYAQGIVSYFAEINDEYTEGMTHGLVMKADHEKSQSFWSSSTSYSDYSDMPNCPNVSTSNYMEDKSGLTNSTNIVKISSGGEFTSTSTLYTGGITTKWFVPSVGQCYKIKSGLYEISRNMTNHFWTDLAKVWSAVSYSDDYNPGKTSYAFFASAESADALNSYWGFETYNFSIRTYHKANSGSGYSTYKWFCCAF